MRYRVATRTRDQICLADGAQGEFKRYWKQLCPFGEWIDPNDWENSKLIIDEKLVGEMVKNFDDKVLDYVPVPLGHPYDSSTLAQLNTGEVIELEVRDDGLYGLIEIRDEEVIKKIDNNLIPNVSMGFDLQYKDKKDGSLKGVVLEHVGLVADPYLKGMKTFEAALSDMQTTAIVLSDSSNKGKEQEMNKVKVKNDRDFDIEVAYIEAEEEVKATIKAGEEIEVPSDQEEAVKTQIADAVKPEEDASGDDSDAALSDKANELAAKEKQLSDERAKLDAERADIAKQKAALSAQEAEAEYQRLLSDGKILPAQKEAFLALSAMKETKVQLSDKETKSVHTLLSEIFTAMPDMRLLSEVGDGSGAGGGDDVELSDEDREIINRFNLSEEDYKEVKREKAQKKETK